MVPRPFSRKAVRLDELLSKRIVLFTGKGGVGRTTVAASAAVLARRAGRRVLVMEVGDEGNDYSPLARHLGRERLPTTPEALAPGLDGVVLLPRTGQELFLRTVLKLEALSRAAVSSDALQRMLSAGPSFREMGVFFQLLTYLREARPDGSPRWELILIDMPATGHTLSLTGLPAVLLRLVSRGPIADALREGQAFLNDPKTGAAFVVTIPETLPVSESLELLEGLRRTSMPTAGIVLNRVPEDPFTAEERAALEPVIARGEVFGAEGFGRIAKARRERERLEAGTTLPIFEVPERPLEGDALLEVVIEALGHGPTRSPTERGVA
jgi:anion-transporting  ArsA/GET3 family ATPase